MTAPLTSEELRRIAEAAGKTFHDGTDFTHHGEWFSCDHPDNAECILRDLNAAALQRVEPVELSIVQTELSNQGINLAVDGLMAEPVKVTRAILLMLGDHQE